MNIYVGNLSYSTTEESLREAFGQHGQVESASVIMDRATGRSRGFGFVVMPDDAEAEEAITNLNGQELDGRSISVNQARERASGPRDGH